MSVPSPASRSGKRIYVSLWDLIWALASPIVALYLRDADVLYRAEWGVVGVYWLSAAGFALLGFFAFRIQDGMTRYFSVHEAIDVAEAVLFAQLMTCLVLFSLTRLDGIPRSMPVIHGFLLAAGLIAVRLLVRILHDDDTEPLPYHWRRERIILIGANRFASFFIRLLEAYAPQQQRITAVLDENAAMIGRAISGARILGTPQDLDAIITEFAIHGVETDRVVIAGEADFLSPAALREVERICKRRQIDLSFLPRMVGITEWTAPPNPAASFEPMPAPPFALPAFFRLKRWIDIAGSLALIVLLLPLFLAASLLTLVDVGRPVLFWQERLGWKGRPFLIYKFRTLRAPFDSAGTPIRGDQKPSAIGRLLRATRIDELPQLLNVLVGDMSLIGPRPLLPEDQPPNTAVRLLVRPGITGWAQVNGAKLVGKDEKEKLDEWYIRNASLQLDFRSAIRTLGLLMLMRPGSSAEALADTEQVQSRTVAVRSDLALNAGGRKDQAAAA